MIVLARFRRWWPVVLGTLLAACDQLRRTGHNQPGNSLTTTP